MKKVFLILSIIAILLTGCGESNKTYVDENGSNREIKFVEINDILSYDINTGIVYIKNRTYIGYFVYTSYYGKNGKVCRYDLETGNIEEIID